MTARLKQLADLKPLRKQLAERSEARELEARAQTAQHKKAEQSAADFSREMHTLGVEKLAPHARLHKAPRAHPPHPLQRDRDEEQVLAESVSDEIDVESLLETDESLSFRRGGIGPDVVRRLRRGEWTIQAGVDLHGHRVDEARTALVAFLRAALKAGLRCVRVVHGKGLGSKDRTPVLKAKVRAWLAQRDEVIAFCQARPADGGSGALIVLLRPTINPSTRPA
jgi:DNA-nicking Smr family endonuclease